MDDPLTPSFGVPPPLPDLWPDFVQEVLAVTVAAYEQMRSTKLVQLGWHENLFTRHLYEQIKHLLKGNPYLRVHYQHEVPTAEMLVGTQPLDETPKIDISFYEDWSDHDYDRVYFAWEAKRIAGKGKYQRLRGKYVAEGIFRFINGKYSADVEEAGMLGYILDGTPAHVAAELNSTMLRPHADPDAPTGTPPRKLTTADNLQLGTPVGSFRDIYLSYHHRDSGRPINLYHLLLTFEFA